MSAADRAAITSPKNSHHWAKFLPSARGGTQLSSRDGFVTRFPPRWFESQPSPSIAADLAGPGSPGLHGVGFTGADAERTFDRRHEAKALAGHYLRMREHEGWTPERLQPLLAGLLELLPW